MITNSHKKKNDYDKSEIGIPKMPSSITLSSSQHSKPDERSKDSAKPLKKRKFEASIGSTDVSSEKWNYEVDYNDHFETPFIAYDDIALILNDLATKLGKDKADLVIYDPYYCKGQMIDHLRQLGYLQIINENKDFYREIKRGTIPGQS